MIQIKTATITFHAPNNYGAFLQAYALQKSISSCPEISNTILNFVTKEQKEKYALFDKKSGFRFFIRNLLTLIYLLPLTIRGKRFAKTRNKFLNMTKEIAVSHEVSDIASYYDVLICGSDQIWNSDLRDFSEVYYLPGNTNKISYAASFGKALTNAKVEYAKKYLDSFNAVSIRESQALFGLKQSGIDTSKIEVNIDPTLLLKGDEYNELIRNSKIHLKGKYILLYSLLYTEDLLKTVKKIGSIIFSM